MREIQPGGVFLWICASWKWLQASQGIGRLKFRIVVTWWYVNPGPPDNTRTSGLSSFKQMSWDLRLIAGFFPGLQTTSFTSSSLQPRWRTRIILDVAEAPRVAPETWATTFPLLHLMVRALDLPPFTIEFNSINPEVNFMRQKLREKFHPAEISRNFNWKSPLIFCWE